MGVSVSSPKREMGAAMATVGEAELLFKEAKQRQRRRRAKWSTLLVVAVASIVFAANGGGNVSTGTTGASGATPATPATDHSIGLLSCAGTSQFEPKEFILACADGNAELTRTVWSNWTSRGASGVTDFGLNLCNPYCAASKISFFPNSKVAVTSPVKTSRGMMFETLVVTYKLNGKLSTYSMDWKGVPAFTN